MTDLMLPLPGLSPVSGKTVVAKFDGGLLSSDGGILVLREIEQRFRVADRLAACIEDPRSPDQITHSLADIIRFRLLMIAAGYEDGNDASNLRADPMFKMALDCNRPTAYIVGARNLALRLLTGLEALDRLALLVIGEFRAPHLHAVRHGTRAVRPYGRELIRVRTRPARLPPSTSSAPARSSCRPMCP